MPSYIFHFVVAVISLVLAFFCAHAGAAHIALAFIVFSLFFVGIGLYELSSEDGY